MKKYTADVYVGLKEMLESKDLMAAYDIKVNSKDYKDKVTVIIPVDEKHNGKKAKVIHYMTAGEETFKTIVEDGKVSVIVSSFSPFVVLMDENSEQTVTPIATENPFTDVKNSDWFCNDVLKTYAMGLMNGTSKDKFSPAAPMSRAMIVTILWRMENSPKVEKASAFTDVAAGQWYTDAIIWASEHGIVNGYGGGKFGPNDSLTRLQMVSILHRYAAAKEMDTSDNGSADNFADASNIADWGKSAVSWAVDNSIVNGVGGNRFDPDGTAQRAQFAAVIQRFMSAL